MKLKKISIKKSSVQSAPLTFDLKKETIDKLETFKKKSQARTLSEVVRYAIDSYDYGRFKSPVKEHKQISVRLPQLLKGKLVQLSSQKKVSLGELLRAALEGMNAAPTPGATHAYHTGATGKAVPAKATVAKAAASKVKVKAGVKKPKILSKVTSKKKTALKSAPKGSVKKPLLKKAAAKKKTVGATW